MTDVIVRTPEGYTPVDTSGGGGGFPPVQSSAMLDDTTLSIPVGVQLNDGMVRVDIQLTRATGEASSYVLTIAASSTGGDFDTLEVDSDNPITTVDVSGVVSGGLLRAVFTGSGGGVLVNIRYRILETLPRI